MATEEPRGDGREQAGTGSGDRSGVGSGDGLGETAGEPWDDLVLDENFVRSAETTEPSARARMLAARWREGGPDPQPWRSDEPPAGWFFSKGRRRRWRRK
ncbi:SGM_3592 family protein [Streptomyces rhizosphaerihabitans]|uniref:SGM_3592 family protein n=1 Tax=Streptomyces rhizosphaerihabitans TaxID=1266770 RepID=UPI0021BFBBCD|nr:hypothetical protein [Streptomyces rhizosphaerihabitans]MCT9005395.1 hypothetical protein [Streptomyces rhizosphaerihabitans]